jgi:hypothetical protein
MEVASVEEASVFHLKFARQTFQCVECRNTQTYTASKQAYTKRKRSKL